MVGCGKSTGADVLGVESEPWVFKGGVSGEVQVCVCITFKMGFANDSLFCYCLFVHDCILKSLLISDIEVQSLNKQVLVCVCGL